MDQEAVPGTIELAIENIGGIDDAAYRFGQGTTILEGGNATNRTSLLRAIMAVFGSERVSLKGDAAEGFVELRHGERAYSRSLERTGDTVSMSGEPYLDDPRTADLFAFLLEENNLRRAVRRSDDLHELLMQPVDTAEIEARIRELQTERDNVEDALAELEDRQHNLEKLERERASLRSEVEKQENELDEIRAEMDGDDAETNYPSDIKDRHESAVENAQELRAELEDVEFRIERERKSLAEAEEELESLRMERVELDKPSQARLSDAADEIERLRQKRERLSTDINDLVQILRFNRERLSNIEGGILEELGSESESVTDALVDSEVLCWACGSAVDRDALERTVEMLERIREEKSDGLSEVEDDIENVKQRKKGLEEKIERAKVLDDRIDAQEDRIGERRSHLQRLEHNHEELTQNIEAAEAEVENLESKMNEDMLAQQRRINELEFEIGQSQDQIEEINSEIDASREALSERESLEERRQEIDSELAQVRNRIRELEDRIVDQFNDHISELFDILEYDNLSRIWIERKQMNTDESDVRFELHVVRSSADGTVYEDSLEHLSESEREVTGLVLALAGYLVHEVHELVPVMLLDSLEAIDANRIATLLDYFAEYAPFLIVALLPEDAQAVGESNGLIEMD